MIQPVDLLPQEYAERRAQRRQLFIVVAAGAALLLALVAWYVAIQAQIGAAEDELAQVEQRNTQLQSQIAELQRFAELQEEVQTKEVALRTVMAGDVAWPSVLTEVAMVVPGEVWLTNLTASAGQTEGASQVGTETAEVRIAKGAPFGRIQFQGKSLTMPGIGKWLIRLGGTDSFGAVWLNSATEEENENTVKTFTFDSTLELNQRAASGRYLSGGGK